MSVSKVMKKNDWLELANGIYNLGLSDSEKLDDIVFKIAKELEIETNSVKIADLKKQVISKIEVIKRLGENADETNEEKFEDRSVQETEENISEESIVKEESKVVYSELDNLRAECIMYGLGYGEKHTVSDLTQLLGQIRGRVPASMTLEEALKQINPSLSEEVAPSMDMNNFELTLDNADIIKENAPSNSIASNSIQLEVKQIEVPVATIEQNLKVYVDSFTQTIRAHFRPHTIHEINGLFIHDYPFKHELRINPENQHQVEIILSMHGINSRVPSEDRNDWIQIRD